MHRWLIAMAVGGCLACAPAWGHDSKRTDPCGCHHQWGLRHCHPNKKTERCEAPASAEKPTPPPTGARPNPPEEDEAPQEAPPSSVDQSW